MGCGARKMAVFLGGSLMTLKRWIAKAWYLQPDTSSFESDRIYDIDKLQTYVGKRSNKVWMTYVWGNDGKQVATLNVGGRSSEDLRSVSSKVIELIPSSVNTDRYPAYVNLLKEVCHRKGKRKANRIERQHVNLRKDVTCLIRETICYQTSDKIKLVNFNEDSNSVVEENIITNIESKNKVHKMYNLVLEDGNTYIVDGIVVSTENSTVVDSFQYFQLYVP